MDMEKAIPSSWLSANDFDSTGKEFTIGNVMMQQVGAEHKPVIFFYGQEKALVINKTNNRVLIGLFGKESNDWAGKKVVLFSYMGQAQFGQPPKLQLGVRAADPGAPAPKAVPVKIPKVKPRTMEEELNDDIPI
jgi:hypothetical protein